MLAEHLFHNAEQLISKRIQSNAGLWPVQKSVTLQSVLKFFSNRANI